MKNLRKIGFTTFMLFVAMLSSQAFGQTSKGTLSGVARDKTGAVISGASVTVRSEATDATRTLKTQKDGSYRLDALDPGPYTISVTNTGFQTFEAKSVQVQASIVTSYDILLVVGNTTDTVTVESDSATLNTENGQLAGVINAAEIDKAPIFSLNPFELALSIPGVQPASNGAFSNGQNIQVDGNRPRSNNYLVDGQEINDVTIAGQAIQPQIPGAFNSLTVITNGAAAEFGRAGGGIANLVTKGGTNQYHGTAFERYNGSGLTSVPGSDRGAPYNITRQSTHSYGFTGGGRIIKDKLFAFGALELQRTFGKEQGATYLLPDANGIAVLNSLTGAPGAQAKLLLQYLNNGAYLSAPGERTFYAAGTDPSLKTPVTTKTLASTTTCGANCGVTFAAYQRPDSPISSPDTQWLYRVDYKPWDKDSISFRYIHDRSSLSPDLFANSGALPGLDTFQGGPSELGQGTWTHIFTPHLLNEFRASEARVNFQFAPTDATLANPVYALPTVSLASLTGSASVGTVGFPTLGPNQGFPQGRKEDLYQFQDTISWTRGIHTVRVGVDIGRLIEIDLNPLNTKGTISYASTATANNGNPATTNSLSNFLLNQLGTSGTVTRSFGPTRVDSHGYRNGVFAQDDIKLTSDLTINLGFRYDFLTNPENNLPYPAVDVQNPFQAITSVVRVKDDYNNVSPRVGFAYSPHGFLGFLGDGKTSIRGGFGIFYDSTFSNILLNSAASAPNSTGGNITGTAANPQPNASALIPTITPVLTATSPVTSEDSRLVNPVTYQYNLGIERQIPGDVVVTARYVGNRGSKLFANQQFNYFNGLTGARINTTRGQINVRGNYADSNYNAVELSASHNFKHGIDIRSNYTYGKDLSDGDEVFATSSPTSYSANLAPGGRGQDYSNSAYDHRHFFSVAYVWSPAGFSSANAFTNAALGVLTRHWTVSGITQLQSGSYTTFNFSGLDSNGDGSSANDRPLVGNASLPVTSIGVDGAYVGGTVGQYYDLAAQNGVGTNFNAQARSAFHFVIPYDPANKLQNQEIGRNSYLLPGTTRNDIALEKGIGLSYLHFEKASLILRAEASNVFNHNDRVVGDLNLLDAGVGFLDGTARAGSNRSIILWGKFQF